VLSQQIVLAHCTFAYENSPTLVHFQLECGPMPNVMAAQPNIGGAFCESSVIPLLVPRRKVWLTPAAGVPCSTLPIYENARLGRKVNFAPGKIPSRGKNPSPPKKKLYSVPAQETAKDRAKFGWPPMSDVAAVTKPRRETGKKYAGAPQTRQQIPALSGPKFAILCEHISKFALRPHHIWKYGKHPISDR